MSLEWQVIIETICTIMLYSFPFALVFMICQKLIDIFTRFAFGKEVKF